MPTIINCPTCQQPVEWTEESAWKPFCSERCRLIDLGAWADGSYSIPGETPPLDADLGDQAPH